MSYVRHLAFEIGPRPSTGEGERRAAAYVQEVMETADMQQVRQEAFRCTPSTYWPFSLALGTGLLGNLLYAGKPGRSTALAAALANLLGVWGFYREANFDPNWMRRVLPQAVSQNVVGVIPAAGERRGRVVLLGHLDTHRTPVFYSSPGWLRLFSTLVGAAFASLLLGALAGVLGLISGRRGWRWLGALGAAFEIFALSMTLQGETTPYSPGANDNASGAATALALGTRLVQEPLQCTEVWVVNTGCEEVGAYGMRALLASHGDVLRDACFLDFDIVGIGQPAIRTREGLLRAYRPDPRLLDLARRVAVAQPELVAGEHTGGAYTDIGVAIKHGFQGLVIDSRLPAGHPAAGRMGYWHQPDDTYDKIERDALAKAHAFGWALLQRLDAFDT